MVISTLKPCYFEASENIMTKFPSQHFLLLIFFCNLNFETFHKIMPKFCRLSIMPIHKIDIRIIPHKPLKSKTILK